MSRDEFVMHEAAEMTAANICNTARYLQRMAEAYEAERDEARKLAEEWRDKATCQWREFGCYCLEEMLPWEGR